ncbi:MAG: lysophospholipid acyltransferase family protein [Thermovirgaceae bacterium]|nr:lysophospholipid acyltransferase family protein [Thermovirgaceae bacterium]
MSLQARVLDGIRKWIRPGWRASFVTGSVYALLRIVRPRRSVALANMEIAFPGSTSGWRRETLSRVYRHFASILAEYLVVQNDPSMVLEWFTGCEGKDHLDRQLSEGKGAVLLMSHFGNWELMAAWLVQNGFPIYGVIQNPSDPGLAELIDRYRKNIGGEPIPKQFMLREPVKRLKEGKMVVVAGDQSWGGRGALRIPFFGKECGTAGGPAGFSLLAGVPLIPVAAFRLGPFSYRIEIGPPIDEPALGTREDKVLEMTIAANRWTESIIKRAPEQWLWMHRRWRD